MAVTDGAADTRARTLDALPASPGRRPLPAVLRDLLHQPRTYWWLLAIAVIAPGTIHELFLRGNEFVIDLHVYRLSGYDLLHHRPVYSWYYETATLALPFTYPPISALLSVPLALLPVRLDAALWYAAVYGCLLWVLRLALEPTRARLRVSNPRLEPFLLPAVFAAAARAVPGLQQIQLGQVGVFLLALVAVDLLTPRTGRFRGVLTGLAAAIKLTPLVFVLVLLAARRFRDAAVAAGSFAGLTALSWAVAPATSQTFWTDTVIHSDRLGDNTDTLNQSLRGAVLRSPLTGSASTVVWLGLAVAVLAAGLLVTTQAHRDRDPLLLVIGGGFLSCLLSPVAWTHHYVWVFLLVAWLMRERRWSLAVGTLLFWGFNLSAYFRSHALDRGWSAVGWQLLGNEFALYAVVVVAVLAVRAWRRAGGWAGVRALALPASRVPAVA